MKLTEHFTLEEMTFSETAIRNNYDNTPNEEQKENLRLLCDNVLEHLRVIIGVPIRINSGFRSPLVNEAVGGVSPKNGKGGSQHLTGQAADTVAVGHTVTYYYERIKQLVRQGKLQVDQCILEYESWVHVSWRKEGNRNQFLIKNHGTGYMPDNN